MSRPKASDADPPVVREAKARLQQMLADVSADNERLERVLVIAIPMFGGRENAMRWLSLPKRRLDSRTPRSLLKSDEGAERVIEFLRAAQYGLLS